MSQSIGDQMQELYQKFGHIKGITIELQGELIAIGITNEQAQATIFLQGAQLLHFQPHSSKHPIIWHSDACHYKSGHAIRGGIPICWPWFGDLAKNPEPIQSQFIQEDATPAHGHARTSQWNLSSIEDNKDGTQVTLTLTLKNWELSTIIAVGHSLTETLSVTNISNTTQHYSSALHSYFAISHVDQCYVNGLEHTDYIDCLDNWNTKQSDTAININQEIDRIYLDKTSSISIVDPGWQRQLHIHSKGSKSAVVWNPWTEKSQQLSQFNANDYQSMLCIETANANTDSITLAPNQSHQLCVTIAEIPA
ncbi:D-hexose-6-phosphate mutarotase [bacterium]|nr:D-hexose-6-phosphate mutarotase [bacterium]